MINLAVINLKDIIKNLVKLIIILTTIIIFTRFFKAMKKINLEEFINQKLEYFNNKTFLECLDDNIGQFKNKEKTKKEKSNLIISQEIPLAGFINYEDDHSIEDNIEENIDISETFPTEENSDFIVPNTNLETHVVEENNKKDVYTNTYGTVQIKNESKYDLTEEMLTPNIDFTNKKDIVIFHTHTCESYTPTEKYNYNQTGNYRTTDLNYSVARVGTELSTFLSNNGFNVCHDTTYHDYPTYTGSYNRSFDTVQSIMKNNSAELVIDLHRDALGNLSTYGPTVKIGDETAAQLMFVIGTNGGGLDHPNWNTNLKLAIKIQEKANEMYPGLFKPIILRNSRYNQNLANCACIIEVGATGNTLEQCLVSMKYLSNVINEVMK